MSASCLYSPTIGTGQTERRMKASRFFSYKHVGPEVNAFPRPESLTPSPRPPTPQSPKVQESHHSTWPLRRLFICIRASQRIGSDRIKNHLEGPSRGRAGCGRKPGVSRRSCGPPATLPRVLTLKPTAACAAEGCRGHSAPRGCTAEMLEEKRPSDQILETSWRRVETFECSSSGVALSDLRTQRSHLKIHAASERVEICCRHLILRVRLICAHYSESFKKCSPDYLHQV